ncbi:unknown [Prevotella sp. CAG:5226]|nr:unknown [Prevotella sp. CAG:5226]
MNNYSITARFVNVKPLRDQPGQGKTQLSNPKTNKKQSWMKRKPDVAITPP